VTAVSKRPLRVLLSLRPYRGHLHPLIPLARAFADRGHEVALATSEDVADIIVGAGLAWLPSGINPRQIPELSNHDPDYGYTPVRAKVDDLLELSFSTFRPDVIVRDPTDLAPIIVCEITGSLDVIYGLSRFIPSTSWGILGADNTIRRLRQDFRRPDDPELRCMFADLYLAVIPPLLEVEDPLPVPAVQRIQYVPWDGDLAGTGGPLVAKGTRPLVLVTLGTVYNSQEESFARLLDAVAGCDVDVVCTLGAGVEPPAAGGKYDSIRFETYLPHTTVLPHCDAVLCHGGFNTVLGSLVAGVPLVCVPLGSDQDWNSYICHREGFGISINPEDATVEGLRDAVMRVITEPSFSDRVGSFQQDMGATPTLAEAVRRIEEMAAAGAGRAMDGPRVN
jgi:UDP:flavonoid glycosyltransferase YjiC (YdhE family)